MIPHKILADDYSMLADLNLQIKNYKEDIIKFESVLMQNTMQLNYLEQKLKKLSEELSKLADLLKIVDSKNKDNKDILIINEAAIDSQKFKLQKLRNSFKNKVVWLYKNGNELPLTLLYTSGSLNQFYIRLQYLNKLSLLRVKDLEKIRNLTYLLEEKKKIEGYDVKEKLKYIGTKKESQKVILQDKLLTEIAIDSIKLLNDILKRQVTENNSKINELNNRILQGVPLFKFNINSKPEYYSFQKFDDLKSKLIIPVNSLNILLDFGQTISPITHTLTNNSGIDFEIAKGSTVRCVADGKVENIFFIPTYGKIISVRHNDKYKTIYGILSKINVAIGQNLKAGEIIALTGNTIEGQMFHFEIWENNTPVDPKYWLKW